MRLGTLTVASFLLCGLGAGAETQEKKQDDKASKKKIKIDFSYRYDPLELHAYSRKATRRWTQIKGPIGLGDYHVPPALETGPYYGPPLHIYGRGFGASVWRDPVTGRYIP
jgi:hypothetical protein